MKRSTRISLLVFTICTAIIAFGALWYTRPSTPSYIIEEAKQRQNVPLLEVDQPATRLPAPVIDYDLIVEKVTPQIKTAILRDQDFMDALVVANKENIQKAVQEYTDANLIPILEEKITSIVIDLSDALTDSIKSSLIASIDETINDRFDNLKIPTQTSEIETSKVDIDIDAELAEINSDIDQRFNSLSSDINIKFNKLDDDFESKINSLIDSLDEKVARVNTDLDSRVSDIEDSVDSKILSVNENVELRLNALFENLYEEAEIAFSSIEVKSYLPEIIDSITPVVVEEVNNEITSHKEDFVQIVKAESPEISDEDLQRVFEEYKYDIVNDVTLVVLDNLEEIIDIYIAAGKFDNLATTSYEEKVVEQEVKVEPKVVEEKTPIIKEPVSIKVEDEPKVDKVEKEIVLAPVEEEQIKEDSIEEVTKDEIEQVDVVEENVLVDEEVVEPQKVKEKIIDTKEEEKVIEVVSDNLPTEEIIYPYGIKEIVKAEGHDVFDLFVIHTADIRGHFEGSSESIGFSRLSTMLEEARSITKNILLLDAGNIMAGSSAVYNYYGETAGILLDTLKYDAIGVSEKEFNFGLDKLVEASKLAKELSDLKVLSANALDDDEYLYFQPYQVYNYNGFKVAVVALTDVVDVDGINFDSDIIIDNAQAAVNIAREYVDYIIVLGNFGANSDIATPIIQHLNGVDLWIDGNNDDISSNGKIIGNTLLVQSGVNFSDLGVVDILVDNKEVKSENAFLINVSDVDDPVNSALANAYGIVYVPEDETVDSFIDTKKESLRIPAPSFASPKVNTVSSEKEIEEANVIVPAAPKINAKVEAMSVNTEVTDSAPPAPQITSTVEEQSEEETSNSINAVIVAQVPEVSDKIIDDYTTEEGDSINIPVFNSTQSQVLNDEDYDNLRDQIRQQAIDDALNILE